MMIKRETDYALRSLIYLSQNKGRIVDVFEIAKERSIPPTFLAKILQKLKKRGIVNSVKGKGGGFYLLKNPKDISVLDIIEIMQGPIYLNFCSVNRKKCKFSNICNMYPLWVNMKKKIEEELKKINFKNLKKEVKLCQK
ncbi:MAG: Rrf2 family transcriptional regulator [Candidatus Hydrothermales bacterium]